MNGFILPLVKKEKIAENTYSFYFDRAKQNLDFLPGQYIRMVLPLESPDDRGNSRFFTIASSPLEKDCIMITTKIIQSAFKKRLDKIRIGEGVQFFGPFGGFVLSEEDQKERVFLAGGIGITPYHSMIMFSSVKNLSIPITLFVSFSTFQEMFWYEKFSQIAKNNKNIKVIYTLTHSDNNWSGEKGRITIDIIKKYVPDILEPSYYIAGPPAMVSAMEEIIESAGVASDKIFIENFLGY